MATCSNCGRDIAPGALVCECGNRFDSELGLSGMKFIGEGGTSLDFSLPKQASGVEKVDFDKLALQLGARPADRGRAYRPLFVIGQKDQTAGRVQNPFGVARLADNGMYVIDFTEDGSRARVQRFDSVTGDFQASIREYEMGLGAEAMDTPAGIAADKESNFYIADMGASCIRKYDPAGNPLGTLGSQGMGERGLMNPQDVDLGANGELYIADTGNSRILVWDKTGAPLRVLGINRRDEGEDCLKAGSEAGEFDEPQGVTVDDQGNVYVADSNNHRIQKISPSGESLLILGEEGDRAGQLLFPNDLRLGADGSIFVSDLNGKRIQKFSADGGFMFELFLPEESGTVGDFDVNPEGQILVALRRANLVVKLEVV